jgi:hypothetical protein
MNRPRVVTKRTKANPFAPIYVRCPAGLTRAGALRWAERRVRRVEMFKHFDFRGFKYNARTGRGVFV